jgi:hypothetical protein
VQAAGSFRREQRIAFSNGALWNRHALSFPAIAIAASRSRFTAVMVWYFSTNWRFGTENQDIKT